MNFCVLLICQTGWRQQVKWLFPVKVVGNLGLPVMGPREMGGDNIFVHSVCFPTDETDRGVDQQDGKNHASSPECEERDAGRDELLKVRLPTRSDMICGYACLRGILSSRRIIQTVILSSAYTFSRRALWLGRVQGAMKVLVWDVQQCEVVP